jgi:hypothetical protein
MNNLSVRERRLIAVAILLLAFAAGWLVLVSPIVDGFAVRTAERERLLDDQARGRRAIGQLGFWRAEAARQHATSPAFEMRAPSAEAASDMARQRLVSAIQAQGGVVRVVRQVSGAGGEVRLHAELQLTLTQLASSLTVFENQKPYAIIEKLSISSDQTAAAGPRSPLDVSMDLGFPYVLAPA